MSMRCPICGEALRGDERACSRCGGGLAAINSMLPIFQDTNWYTITIINAECNNISHLNAINKINKISNTQSISASETNIAKTLEGDAPTGRIAQAYAKLHLIKIGCPEPQAAARIHEAMSFLECEWRYHTGKPSRRMIVQIRSHELRTYR